jgi:hypothetical protein
VIAGGRLRSPSHEHVGHGISVDCRTFCVKLRSEMSIELQTLRQFITVRSGTSLLLSRLVLQVAGRRRGGVSAPAPRAGAISARLGPAGYAGIGRLPRPSPRCGAPASCGTLRDAREAGSPAGTRDSEQSRDGRPGIGSGEGRSSFEAGVEGTPPP